MTAPLYFAYSCARLHTHEPKKDDKRGILQRIENGLEATCEVVVKLVLATACDILLFITSLTIGILGAMAVISLPPAASYTLIGIGSTIFALWLPIIIGAILVQFEK